MSRFVIIHVGEIALKRGNRDFFERILKNNIARALKGVNFSFVPLYGRFGLEFPESVSEDEISIRLKRVFGIANFSFTIRTEQDYESFSKLLLEEVRKRQFETFCVRVNRVQKNFPKTSVELERELGAFLLENGVTAKVRLKNPELNPRVDLINKDAFLSFERIRGMGGLPVGSAKPVISLLSAGIDSPVSSYRMMKRGCRVIFAHFHSYPYTDAASQENVRDIVKVLDQYQFGSKIYFVPFGEFQKMILTKAPEKFRVLLYRCMMMRISQHIARKEGALGLVTGESLGQVASQTLENLLVTNSVVSLPVYRPLIGMDKQEIIEEARKIGTYDISIQPYGDCCSLFVPKHPETKAKVEDIEKVEADLEVKKWIDQITEKIPVEKFKFISS